MISDPNPYSSILFTKPKISIIVETTSNDVINKCY